MAAEVKPKNNRVLMILGIVIAFVAAALVILTGGGKQGGGETAGRTQDVVVAAVDIPAGQQVSDSLVKVVKFAPDQVPANALTTVKSATGQYSATPLARNSLLTSSSLVPTLKSLPAQKKPYLDIPAGQVAIAIPAGGELQAVAGYIQPDDRVDVIYNPAGTSKVVWKTTYQNLRVARLGSAGASATTTAPGGAASAAAAASTSLVVYVSLEDAENLSLLFSNGNYKLALRSQADAVKGDTQLSPGATTDSLSAKFNIPK